MYGSSAKFYAPSSSNANNTANAKQTNAGVFGADPGDMSLLGTFIAFIVAYLLWAVFQQHQKLKAQVQPKNMAINFHNLLTTVLTVVVAFGLIKLLLAKLVAAGVPGSTTIANIIKFAV